jgi:tRNA-specific 2-thiouridylase
MAATHREKDQSYALWGLSQESLSRTIFPLGDISKNEVRSIAAELGLKTAEKPDSQDICFVPDGNYRKFLRDNVSADVPAELPGEVIGPDGAVIGTHSGISGFTIGQRKGMGIAAAHPLYVTRIDVTNNRVFVNWEDGCYSKVASVHDLNWVSIAPPDRPIRCGVKIRYRDTTHEAVVVRVSQDSARIEFAEPVRAVTPGQSAVFYEGDMVLGGGEISISEMAGER